MKGVSKLTIEVTILIAIFGAFMTLLSVTTMLKRNNKEEGILQGQISNDIAYVKRSVDAIPLELKDISREMGRMKESIIKMDHKTDEAIKAANDAHKRIDKLVKKEGEN